jgi:hypothetical protein
MMWGGKRRKGVRLDFNLHESYTKEGIYEQNKGG